MLGMLLSLLLVAQAYAQSVLKGTVKDTRGEALIGVNVVIDKTTKGTVTDLDGKFSLQVANGNRLRISYMGYKTQFMNYTGQSQLNIVLEDDAKQLEDVVVTALGVEKANTKIGYAISEVKGEALATTNTISPMAALQGKVAGVDINISGTSGVQSSPNIMIRGTKSLSTSNQPIFVIDGIVMENNIAATEGADWGSQLKNLNPDDYEAITVLKGAAATALYGSRGANGAVVITTKKGTKRKGLGIELGHTYQVETAYRSHINLQDKYGMGYWGNGKEGGFPESGALPATANSWGPQMNGQMVQMPYAPAGTLTSYSAQPDNWKSLYQNGGYINTNLALSGGGENGTFRVSYSNTHSKGIMPSNSFDRNAISLRGNNKLNDIFSTEFGVSYTKSTAKNPAYQGRWQAGNMGRSVVYGLPRNFNIEDYKQYYRAADKSLVNQPYGLWNELSTLLHRLDYLDEQRDEESFLANLDLKIKLSDKIDFLVKGNYNLYKVFGEKKEWGSGKYFDGGYYGINGSYSANYNGLAMAHYKEKFGSDWDLDVRMAAEVYGNNRSESWGRGTSGGLITPGVFNFGNSKNESIPWYGKSGLNNMTIGLSGIVNLSWKDQINLEITGRNDWLSSLLYPSSMVGGANNYTVFYPSANLSWVATETFKNELPSWVSFAKLRASVARVGMGTSRQFATSMGGFNQTTIRDENGNAVIVATPNGAGTMPNLDLKPEIQQSMEFGGDVRFLNDRLGLDFAWYRFNTYNQIMTVPNTSESGTMDRWINAGNIQNQGVELLLTGRPIESKDLNWDMSLNFTRNRGKVVALHAQVKEHQLMGDYEGVQVWAYEGGAFGVMTSNNVGATFQAKDENGNPIDHPNNGKPIMHNRNEAGGVEYYRYASEGEMGMYNENYKRSEIGNIQPKFLFGFNNTVRYKQFDLNVQIDGRVGGSIYSSSYALGMGRGNLEATLQYRDKESGGLPRTNKATGEIEYNGVVPDAVFREGMTITSAKTGEIVDASNKTYQELYEAGHLEPLHAAAYYNMVSGWSYNTQNSVMENTWVMLREISLGYRLPNKWVNKIGLQNARLGFSARNIGFLYNGLKGGLNPMSIQGNNPFAPVEYGGTPYSRTFAFSINMTL